MPKPRRASKAATSGEITAGRRALDISIGDDAKAPGRVILTRFVSAVENGHKVDPADMRTLATAFIRILKGEPPEKALALRRIRRGRPAKSLFDVSEEMMVAGEIVILRDLEGLSRKDAVKAVAERRKITAASAGRYYDTWEKLMGGRWRRLQEATNPRFLEIAREMTSLFGDVIQKMTPQEVMEIHDRLKPVPPSRLHTEIAIIKTIIARGQKKGT